MQENNSNYSRQGQPAGAGTQQQPAQFYQPAMPGAMPGAAPAMPGAMPGAVPPGQMVPSTVASPYYLAGYLQRHIGKTVRVEFSLGTTGALTDRTGQLKDVGASYIVLRQYPSNFDLVGDLYSIKFVTIYN